MSVCTQTYDRFLLEMCERLRVRLQAYVTQASGQYIINNLMLIGFISRAQRSTRLFRVLVILFL